MMKTLIKQTVHQISLTKILAVAAILVIVLANNAGLTVRAAVRLPEEALSTEPWLLPSNDIPAVADTAPIPPLVPPAEVPRRAVALATKLSVERVRRVNGSRREKQALAELLELVAAPGEEQRLLPALGTIKNCREFVVINC